MSKGDHYRPIENREAFDKNFERIFGVSKQELTDIIETTEEPDTTGQKPVVEGWEPAGEITEWPKDSDN